MCRHQWRMPRLPVPAALLLRGSQVRPRDASSTEAGEGVPGAPGLTELYVEIYGGEASCFFWDSLCQAPLRPMRTTGMEMQRCAR